MATKNSPSFLIQTLGCKVNQYDSERLRARLLRQGFRSCAGENGEPDLIIVNTCSVTSESDRKGRQLIRKLVRRFPNARLAVTGCYAERKPEEILRIPGVGEVIRIEDQETWAQRVADELGWGCEDQDALWEAGEGIELFEEHTRAFVKIQDGCDLKCTFCSIPQSRGRARGRPMPEIVAECATLVRHGYPEIVLCGICLGQYGRGTEIRLPQLVRAVAAIEGIQRVRISSLEPQDVSDDLFAVMTENPEIVCPHLHLPLQSGSNRILRRMKRPYTAEYFRERVEHARERIPRFEVSTDIMVGFPGESEEDFEQSLTMVRAVRFNKVHSFRYSRRENTPAVRMQNHLPPPVIEDRRRRLDEAARAVADEVKRSYIGSVLPVLPETPRDQCASGFTPNYLRVDFTSGRPILPGCPVMVRLTGLHNGRLVGETLD
ncbi:MAG: tRNA (N(6)-L-threonylcarbamoyladenosine(37)-C(2))-methylthiotransferase MtaB [Candidatus Omnitrophica bacterium]|nr:tRNA (N(6)-L-threonylcarbamoyladenosine(37)-C(2))-methylthiotransferase MtaB [Candidatus Omnitrophota bacterium]